MRTFILLAAVILPVGCTTPAPPADIEMSEMDTDRKLVCDAEPAQSFVGQNADSETGMAILKASGAARLRWGPPDSAWTMDYRPDRVNVRYDQNMTITDITCG